MGIWSQVADLFDPTGKSVPWATPGDMAAAINPKTVRTPALDMIDAALVEAFNTPDSRLIISMPPQEGKSTRVALDFPVWALAQRPDMSIVTASYSQSLADRNGRFIRNRVIENPELGLRISKDNGSVREWSVQGEGGGVYSAGIESALTGRKADMLIIDDPHKDRAAADSALQRDKVWDWYSSTANSRLSPGAPVVLILTRWHNDDLAARLIERDPDNEWKVINIPAQADHKPERGELDVLGRKPGEFMVSARGRTQLQWEKRKAATGPKDWASLYQGRPSPEEGGVFPPADDWARYDKPMWLQERDGRCLVPGAHTQADVEIVQSWDMTFKDTASSDYVVGQVWLRVGINVFLLDQIRARLSFNETIEAVKALSAKWPQAIAKFVEDKANGPAVMNALSKQIGGFIPIEPEGSKYARANAVSPFVFAKNVHLPEPALLPNVSALLEEAKNFPNDTHDDTIDAMSQAVNRLLLLPLLNETIVTADQLYDMGTTLDYASPY